MIENISKKLLRKREEFWGEEEEFYDEITIQIYVLYLFNTDDRCLNSIELIFSKDLRYV